MSDTEKQVVGEKRGRGRPPKPKTEESGEPGPKRPRGRPKGSTKKPPKVVDPDAPKRPRGRPLGSVKKSPQKSPTSDENKPKDKRGRPKKMPSE